MPKFTYDDFTNFCNTIDLQKYREEYNKIKIVEMDLPISIQAISLIYEIYWDNINNLSYLPLYEEFYEIYYNRYVSEIKKFSASIGFSEYFSCFQKGLKARIYRTWVSLIGQIHTGFLAKTIFGEENVFMNSVLDRKGIDILVHHNNEEIKFQIKKDSKRPDISKINKIYGKEIRILNYIVPVDYNKPKYIIKSKFGQLKPWTREFIEFNKDAVMNRLSNGFVIFTDKIFDLD